MSVPICVFFFPEDPVIGHSRCWLWGFAGFWWWIVAVARSEGTRGWRGGEGGEREKRREERVREGKEERRGWEREEWGWREGVDKGDGERDKDGGEMEMGRRGVRGSVDVMVVWELKA